MVFWYIYKWSEVKLGSSFVGCAHRSLKFCPYIIYIASKPKDHDVFCGRVPWLYQYWPGGFMLFVVLCPGTPEGSTGSGSGFKASQKTGQRLKVSSDRLGEAGNRTCDPWFTSSRRHYVMTL